MGLEDTLEKSRLIALDTSIFIYYIEKSTKYFDLLDKLFKKSKLQSDLLKITTSIITLIEVLTKPLAENQEQLANKYRDILLNSSNTYILELNTDIAEKSAILKSKYKFLKTPDAIQLATAIYSNSDLFLSNDKKLQNINEINVVILDQLLINK